MIHRFYSPSSNIRDNKIFISDKDQVHHIKDVLRLRLNDSLVIFDEESYEFKARIEKLSPQGITLKVIGKLKKNSHNKYNLTIACAIPKISKMDDIVDKLTQLGVKRIIPMLTQRVVVKLTEDRKLLRQERWKKILLSATQQSQSNCPPALDSIKDIKEILANAESFDLKLIPTLIGKTRLLKKVLETKRFKNILVLIGPEGDFSELEVRLAKKAGFIPISLGDSVLRVETAAVAVASFIILYGNI